MEKSTSILNKKVWVRPGRSMVCWDDSLNVVTIESEWKENFRIFKSTFLGLFDHLTPLLEKRRPLSVETQVEIASAVGISVGASLSHETALGNSVYALTLCLGSLR